MGAIATARRIGRRTALCCLLALLIGAASPLHRAKGATPHAGDSNRTVAEVSAYWTPQRMDRAKPLVVEESPPSGRSGSVDRATLSGSPVSYSSFELTDTLSFPNRVHGKVFFTRPGVGNFVCSGTVVDAGNRSTVITAGHCVHNGGLWSTNLAFAPGYRNLAGFGNAPYGVWGASDEAAPQPWIDAENLKYDVGAAVIAHDAAGRSLENVVGARGIAFNQPTAQRFRSHGYPAQSTSSHPTWDGTRLWACDSSPPILDNPGGATGPSTMGIGCDMTGGSSGGGWVMTDAYGRSYVNGLNSYKYSNQPEVMYGPYFGSTARAVYDFAAAAAPGSVGSAAVGNAPPVSPDPSSITLTRRGCMKPKKRPRRRRAAKRACKAKRAAKKS